MKKVLIAMAMLAVVISGCQKEITPLDLPQTSKTQNSDTLKAIVIDGALEPSIPANDYDSMVYNISNLQSTITHYYKGGQVMWQEFLTYDTQKRVTSYKVDWGGSSFTDYHFVHYSYTGTGMLPTAIVDTFDDGTFTLNKIALVSSTNTQSGKQYILSDDYYSPSYQAIYNLKVNFDANENILTDRQEDGFGYYQASVSYNANGLIDSIIDKEQYPSLVDSNGLRLRYTSYDNPLYSFSKILYKNLYKYCLLDVGGTYAWHLSVVNLPDGLFEPKLPLSVQEFDGNVNPSMKYDYTYQFNAQQLTGIGLTVFDGTYKLSSTAKIRIY